MAPTNPKTAAGQRQQFSEVTGVSHDPLQVNSRLYRQISELLKDLESPAVNISTRERIAALVAIGRIQTLFVGLRKENQNDTDAGSTVRKYAAAFSKNATGGRKKAARSAPTAVADPIDWDDDDTDDAS
jgi:hypothetical protein